MKSAISKIETVLFFAVLASIIVSGWYVMYLSATTPYLKIISGN